MFLIYLTLFTALSVSAIAIYYSVIGLTTIFAASVIPVAIMGTALEVSKLVTAVWLHKNWREAVWWLKSYLSLAVIILMFITSMGIFGFLSKSHIEQTAASDEQTAKIESINGTITRGEAKVSRLQSELDKLNLGTADTRVDTLIEREQKELERLTTVANAEKSVLREAAEKSINDINAKIDTARAVMETELANTFFGKDSVRKKFDDSQAEYNNEIQDIRTQLSNDLRGVDLKHKPHFDEVNNRLSKLKVQSEEKTGNIETRAADIETQIAAIQKDIDSARENKAVMESQYRKLEAEVGPVKYIAEFIYGQEANRNLLEEAVRWVIVTIIFVFDPLAVLLLIASQYSFEQARAKREPVLVTHNNDKSIDDIWNDVPILEEVEQESKPAASKKKKTVKKAVYKKKTIIKEENDEQVDTNKEPAQDAEQTTKKSTGRISKKEEVEVYLHADSRGYVIFNGKKYATHALTQAFPELRFNFQSEVGHGSVFPRRPINGDLFLRSDFLPTKLYRYNGKTWDPQDKNVLTETAFSNSYLQLLTDMISSNDYDPELLNTIEKKLIQAKITNEL